MFDEWKTPIYVNDKNAQQNIYNLKNNVTGYAGIPKDVTGMAEKLNTAGYDTHQVGKWDAGMATPTHTPKGRGFDSSFGYFHHANDYYNETCGNGCKWEQFVGCGTLISQLLVSMALEKTTMRKLYLEITLWMS